jgi:autotransporter adhesin
MWYPNKAAFRSGHVGRSATRAADWDDKNVGRYSTALGVDTRASGMYSTAIGLGNTASDQIATALGGGTTASGQSSTAMGSSTTASGFASTAMGNSTTASGYNSTALGRDTQASGQYSLAAGFSTTAQAWASVAIGRYNTLTGDSDNWVLSDPLFVVGNGTVVNRADAFTVFKDAGLVAAGRYEPSTSTDRTIPATGAGVRMMWYPEKAAFRAGACEDLPGGGDESTAWDDANVGSYSTAFGRNTIASGQFSTALGTATEASGTDAVAMNWSTNATANASVATGYGTTASGDYSVAMGFATTSQAYGSLVLGRYNTVGGQTDSWVSTDPVLVVGHGSSNNSRSNALFLRKNGDLTIAGTLTENSDARLKKDVTALTGVLPKIVAIRGVTYRFKDEDTGPAGTHVGLLAQEVRDAFPELVSEDADGTLSVAYGKFTAVLLEAVKEQQSEIDSLREELAKAHEDLAARLVRLEETSRAGSR